MQIKSSPAPQRIPQIERIEVNNTNNVAAVQQEARLPPRGQRAQSPSSPPPPSGKYSLMQFAMHNFRQSAE